MLASEQCAVFVSYYHHADQSYYDLFRQRFVTERGLVVDCSLPAPIPSRNPRYILRCIRERHLTAASCLLVLCGPQTRQRKFVDWEIKAALDRGLGLIGVGLPELQLPDNHGAGIPERLADNIGSGFALWTTWHALIADPASLRTLLRDAQARPQDMIRNRRPMRKENGEESGWLGSRWARAT